MTAIRFALTAVKPGAPASSGLPHEADWRLPADSYSWTLWGYGAKLVRHGVTDDGTLVVPRDAFPDRLLHVGAVDFGGYTKSSGGTTYDDDSLVTVRFFNWINYEQEQDGAFNGTRITLMEPWNSIKNIAVTDLSTRYLYVTGFVDTVVHTDDQRHVIEINNAKRGEITTGDATDEVEIHYLSNEYSWSNHFTVATGDGNDWVRLRPDETAASVRTREPMTFNLHPDRTTGDVDAGAGDDSVYFAACSGTIFGGAGNDALGVSGGHTRIWGGAGNDIISAYDRSRAPGQDPDPVATAWIDGGPGQDSITVGKVQGGLSLRTTVQFVKDETSADPAVADWLSGNLGEIRIDLKGYAAGSTAVLSEDGDHMRLTITDAADQHVNLVNLYGSSVFPIASASDLDLHWV